ncbi:MAG: hypothetical protein JXB38_22435 [Anaerolineales bacterium]|nr:hypothetical protein [Anaerolineales bacterium]
MAELLGFFSFFYIIAGIACLGTIFGAVTIGLYVLRMVRSHSSNHTLSLSTEIPAEGVTVPLVAATVTISQTSSVMFGQNNINPLLILYPDRIAYRYLVKKEMPYSQIDSVAVYPNLRLWARLRFTFNDDSRPFIAWLASQRDLDQISAFLESKGVRVDANTW